MRQSFSESAKRLKRAKMNIHVTHIPLLAPLNSARIAIPDIRLQTNDGGPSRIEWRIPNEQLSPPLSGCLDEFIKLRNAEDAKIVEFARRWGVLGICRHGLPGVHLGCRPLGVSEKNWDSPEHRIWSPLFEAQRSDAGWHWEPTDAWRYMASRVNGFLMVAADLRSGRDPLDEDLAELLPVYRKMARGGWKPSFRHGNFTASQMKEFREAYPKGQPDQSEKQALRNLIG